MEVPVPEARGGGKARALVAEFVGTALLLVAVVGSGITATVDGPAAAQLFYHAVAVGSGLAALVWMFASVSGAHLNPAAPAAAWWLGELPAGRAARYGLAQLAGAAVGRWRPT